jgi:polyhydroxyalkanoate synthase
MSDREHSDDGAAEVREWVEAIESVIAFEGTDSGHVAGVINPPARNKRSHWLNDKLAPDPQTWFDHAQEKPGSWWPDWDAWTKRHSGRTVPAPETQGNAQYSPIEPAPGRYVKEKSN